MGMGLHVSNSSLVYRAKPTSRYCSSKVFGRWHFKSKKCRSGGNVSMLCEQCDYLLVYVRRDMTYQSFCCKRFSQQSCFSTCSNLSPTRVKQHFLSGQTLTVQCMASAPYNFAKKISKNVENFTLTQNLRTVWKLKFFTLNIIMCLKWSNCPPQVLSARNFVCQDIFHIVFIQMSFQLTQTSRLRKTKSD